MTTVRSVFAAFGVFFLFHFHYRPQRSWGKVISLQASVILSTGGGGCLLLGGLVPGAALSGGCLVQWGVLPGDAWSGGVPAPGGECLVLVGVCAPGGVPAPGGAWFEGVCAPGGVLPGGGLVETPRDGYCCGWYASYWNAFLF